MQVSLNDLVSILALRVGQPWNTTLQEEMKVVLNYKRADFFKKLIAQNPGQRKMFRKDITAELIDVDRAECPIEVDCEIKRTRELIPRPVRTTDEMFEYVGSADKTEPYGYATPEAYAVLSKYSKYTYASNKYYYANGYVYILGDGDADYIGIGGIWAVYGQTRLNYMTLPVMVHHATQIMIRMIFQKISLMQ
jgi:hypothetical protein